MRGPDGETRTLRHPWSVLAFQLAGADGLRAIHADGLDLERETPPAEPLLMKLIETPGARGLATLILVDEVLGKQDRVGAPAGSRARQGAAGPDELPALRKNREAEQAVNRRIPPLPAHRPPGEHAGAGADGRERRTGLDVTVDERNDAHAFRLPAGTGPLFAAIKNDERARIKETPVDAEALLPDGPYDLWREDDEARRVEDLAGAFARFPRLPKVLSPKILLDTVLQGVERGLFVARLVRPNRSFRTWWREAVDPESCTDPALDLVLPERAELARLADDLLAPGALPALWPAGSNPKVTLRAVTDYVPTMGRRRPCPRAPVHAGASAPAGRVRPIVA